VSDQQPRSPSVDVADLRRYADLGLSTEADARLARRMEHRIQRSSCRGPRRSAPHPARRTRLAVVTLVAVLSLSGVAVAALVVTRQSAPLDGRFAPPGTGVAHPDVTYRFAVRPSLSVGTVGWCTFITLTDHGRPGGGGSACGAGRDTTDPVFDAGSLSMLDRPGDRRSERQIAYALVDGRIAGGRRGSDGVVVAARNDPRLPAGWRSIVVVQAGAHGIGYVGPDDRPVRRLTDTEAAAARLPEQARRRVGPGTLSSVTPCGLSGAPGSALRITRGLALRHAPTPTRDVNGRAFLGCSSASVSFRGRQYLATVLLDATDPGGARPAGLPGAVDCGDGDVELEAVATGGPARARRAGTAWIVVQGPDAAGRQTVLRDLRVPRS
jgi:hypothetical protein